MGTFNKSVKTAGTIVAVTMVLLAFQNCAPFNSAGSRPTAKTLDFDLTLASSVEPDFQCKSNSAPSPINARRLLKVQYTNTIRSLVRGLTVEEATAAYTNIFATEVPDDTATGPFVRTDNSLSDLHFFGYFHVANNFAKHMTGNAARMEKFVKHYIDLAPGTGCTTVAMPEPSNACVTAFVNNFGLRAFRRPLASEERDLFVTQYNAKGKGVAGFSATVFRFLLSPQFLLQLENQGEYIPGRTDVVQLTDYELASRLSYHFLNNMPNEQLLTDAKDGKLTNPQTYATIVNRVMSDAKTPAVMDDFYEGWLGITSLVGFNGSADPTFQYLANGINYDASLARIMRTEVKDLTRYLTFSKNAQFEELFTSNISFARDARLMAIYDQATPAPETVTEENAIRFPASERVGVLTRAALIANGTAYENPILKGVQILDDFLCKHPKSADAEDLPEGSLNHPPPNLNLTTRERWAAKTAAPQCAQCHFSINPIGFGLAAYTTLGKYRTEEAVFNAEGAFVKNLPVNDDVDLSAVLGSVAPIRNPAEYSKAVGSHMATQKCISQKYYEFTYGRSVNVEQDGCALQKLRKTLGSRNHGIKDFLSAVAFEDSFKLRLIQE